MKKFTTIFIDGKKVTNKTRKKREIETEYRCVICDKPFPPIPVLGNAINGYYYDSEQLEFIESTDAMCMRCCLKHPVVGDQYRATLNKLVSNSSDSDIE